MKCEKALIVNKLGMHARASAKFVSLAAEFASDVTIARAGRQVNGKSIMGIMMLASAQGTEVEICADGADEAEAVAALKKLIEGRFGEEE